MNPIEQVRSIMRKADEHRRNAERATSVAVSLGPDSGIRLVLQGHMDVSDRDLRKALQAAAEAFAATQLAEAERLEAQIQIKEDRA